MSWEAIKFTQESIDSSDFRNHSIQVTLCGLLMTRANNERTKIFIVIHLDIEALVLHHSNTSNNYKLKQLTIIAYKRVRNHFLSLLSASNNRVGEFHISNRKGSEPITTDTCFASYSIV